MKITAYTVIIFGVLVLAGGLMGYQKAQSIPSLVAGTVFGLVFIGSGWAMLKGSIIGYYSSITFSALLALFFCYRFYGTQKFMPPGLMAILSVLLLVFLIVKGKRETI